MPWDGRNTIAIEVSNPAINTFYLPEQNGFLFAEVVADGRTLAATGRDFKAMRLPRTTKTNRFSYQREFAEFYHVAPGSYDWRTNGVTGAGLRLADDAVARDGRAGRSGRLARPRPILKLRERLRMAA